MTLLDRLREWVRARLPTQSTGRPAETASGTIPEVGRRCHVCGTVTDSDATSCPLCGGSDLRPVEDPERTAAGSATEGPASPSDTTRQETDTDEAAARLRRLRTEGPSRDETPDRTQDDNGDDTNDTAA